jgi:type I restriction enzyme R subunit
VNRAFAKDGGAKRLDALLGKQLNTVLDTLAANLWDAAG